MLLPFYTMFARNSKTYFRFLSRFRMVLLLVFLISTQSCSSQVNLIEDELLTVTDERYRYYLYFPEDYERNKDKEFPLLLFLHGGGESGGNLDDLQTNGPPKMIVEGRQFPFLILAPQHPEKKKFWNTRAVMQLLDSVVTANRVDRGRIYLSGLSRGGSAAWEIAVQYPEKFAAMAIVCGMTPTPYAHWISEDMPIWVFHGEEDPVIPIEESEQMVAKLKEMGKPVRFTRYKDVGHDAWVKAYQTDALYEWLLGQKKKQ